MRFFRILASVICLLAAASAAEIKIKVVDPQSAVVAGAQVVLTSTGQYDACGGGDYVRRRVGRVSRMLPSGSYQVQVLAPDLRRRQPIFQPYAEMAHGRAEAGAAAETVVVTATRTPVPTEAAGADVETLSGAQIADHAAGRSRRCDTVPARRGREHRGTAGRPVLSVRARRRFDLQQSYRGWRHRQ